MNADERRFESAFIRVHLRLMTILFGRFVAARESLLAKRRCAQ
jgi:hypothetical protein